MLIVYSKNNCPFCDKAKHLLKSNGIEFEEIKIDEDPKAREWLIAQGHRSAPQIYLGETLFVEGGYQGLVRLSVEQIQQRIGALSVSK
jgi:glutaredoxin 3